MRLASHAAFRAFVADAGLEFYPLGGDPVTLARCAAQTGGESTLARYWEACCLRLRCHTFRVCCVHCSA